jgi:tRNA modification GTPase
LVDARTVAAADSALAGLSGGLGREVQAMRLECVDLLVEMDVR